MKQHKIVVAIDSFKGSATSKEAGEWVKQGILKVAPTCEVQVISIADGGEGTLDSLIIEYQGVAYEQVVSGPMGQRTKARFGMLDQQTAVIEMAEVSGISLTEQNEQDALQATTYGVGELLLAAIEKGATIIYIGLGGSGTTDGGAGMAQAIGAQMTDSTGKPIKPGALGLKEIAHISMDQVDPRIKDVEIRILSDVTNPLLGKSGAAAIYGPQKGIPEERIQEVDGWLRHYSEILKQDLGIDLATAAGGGAAGGLGAGLLAFTNAKMIQGIEEILKLLHFEEKLQEASLVITGEGKLDNQSIHGKAPIGIARLAKKKDLPVIAVVATRDQDLSQVYEAGIDLVLSIIDQPMTLQTAIETVKENTVTTGETAMRAYLLSQTKKGDQS